MSRIGTSNSRNEAAPGPVDAASPGCGLLPVACAERFTFLNTLQPLFRAVLSALVLTAALHAARDDEIIAQLHEQIRELEKTPAESSGLFEKQRVDRRLTALRQELAVLEKRRQLETQERSLHATANAQPNAQLRERLTAVAPDSSGAEARQRELANRRTKATTERETLAQRLAEARRATTPAAASPAAVAAAASAAAEAEERIITKDEELRAIALRTEAAENESDLVRLAQTLRERIRAAEGATTRPTLRSLFSQQTQEQEDAQSASQLAARASNLEASLRNSEAGLDLQRQKLAGLDEEIRLFDTRSVQSQRRTPRMEQMLVSDRLQHRMLGERLPFIVEQVEALRQSRGFLQAQLDLLALEAQVRATEFAAMRSAYLARLRTPFIIIVALWLIFLVVSRLVLPLRPHALPRAHHFSRMKLPCLPGSMNTVSVFSSWTWVR